MNEKDLSKYEKEPSYSELDYIPESGGSMSAPSCEWCNELLDVSEAKLDSDGRLYVECRNCAYINYLDK